MSKFKIIGADQKEYGPVGIDEMRVWLHEGRANGQSLVQPEGATGWQPLDTIPELAALIVSIAAAPAPFSTVPVVGYQKTNTMAVAGFVCSLIGALCCMTTVFSIAGLILCIVALRQIARDPLQKGKGLAISGIVIAFLGLIGAAIGWIYFLVQTAQGIS